MRRLLEPWVNRGVFTLSDVDGIADRFMTERKFDGSAFTIMEVLGALARLTSSAVSNEP